MSEYVYNDIVTQPEHSEVSAYMFLLNKQTNKNPGIIFGKSRSFISQIRQKKGEQKDFHRFIV